MTARNNKFIKKHFSFFVIWSCENVLQRHFVFLSLEINEHNFMCLTEYNIQLAKLPRAIYPFFFFSFLFNFYFSNFSFLFHFICFSFDIIVSLCHFFTIWVSHEVWKLNIWIQNLGTQAKIKTQTIVLFANFIWIFILLFHFN